MDFIVIKRNLSEYRSIIHKKDKSIGSIIKHHRRERDFTLEETVYGICSVSYLCKVENNQLIPSQKILDKLLERLQINEEAFEYNKKSDWLNDIVNNKNVPNTLYEEVKNKNDYKSKLIKYAYIVLNEQKIEKSYDLYIDLTDYFAYFSEQEMIFYLYLLIISYYKKERFSDVINIYKEIEMFSEHEEIILLSKIILLKSLYKIDRKIDIKIVYEELLYDLLKLNRFDEIKEIRNYELAYLAKELETDDLKNKLHVLKNIDNINLDYIWFCHYYYKKTDFENALIYIEKIARVNEYYFIMYLIVLDKLKRKTEIIKLIKNQKIIFTKVSNELICEYLVAKYVSNEVLDFVNNHVLYATFMIENAGIINYLYAESYRYLKDNHLYKATVKILEKQINNFKKNADPIFM